MPVTSSKSQKSEKVSEENKIFSSILESSPQIKILSLKPDGDFVFSVQTSDLNLTAEVLDNEPIAQTVFFANFVGELLVRRNLHVFTAMLDQLSHNVYGQMVNHYQHKHFGMRRVQEDDSIRFVFHSSLIQDILTEDMVNLFCM